MKKRTVRRVAGTLAAALWLLAPTVTSAESDPEDLIKYRRNVMKSNGANMAALGAILQGKVKEFDKRIADHARSIQITTRNIPALFPEGSDFGDTEALESVWKKPAEFKKKAEDTSRKADALAKVAAGGDRKAIEARFRELSDSCKACHKDFRKEQK